MDYNKIVLKRWSRTILSICSTLLNVPLKLKGRSRIRLGFGFFFCVFTIIFPCRCPHNAAVRRHRRKTAGLPVLSSGLCFPPGGASCCFHGPFTCSASARGSSGRPLEPSASAFSFSGIFALLQNRAYESTAKALDFPKENPAYFFVFILLILFRILPKKPGKNNPRGEMK